MGTECIVSEMVAELEENTSPPNPSIPIMIEEGEARLVENNEDGQYFTTPCYMSSKRLSIQTESSSSSSKKGDDVDKCQTEVHAGSTDFLGGDMESCV